MGRAIQLPGCQRVGLAERLGGFARNEAVVGLHGGRERAGSRQAGAAGEDIHCAGDGLAVDISADRADDQIRFAVAIDIAGGKGPPDMLLVDPRAHFQIGGGGEEIGHAQPACAGVVKCKDAPVIVYAAIEIAGQVRRAGDQVGAMIAIHIAAQNPKTDPIVAAVGGRIILRVAGPDQGEIGRLGL